MIVQQVLVNTVIYAPLHSRLAPSTVHKWDITVGRAIRVALKMVSTSCRQGLYCEAEIGGLRIPSLVIEIVAAIARETLVALNGDELDGVLVRETGGTLQPQGNLPSSLMQ
jgi:hypothetical protein